MVDTMDEEWCREKLENLKIKENRISTLTEIRGRLSETSKLESIVTSQLLNAPEIYGCLEESSNDESANSAEVNLASEILSICMTNLTINPDNSSGNNNTNNMPQLLQRALDHQRSRIRALALNTLLKEMQRQPQQQFAVSDALFMQILLNLHHEDIEVAAPSSKILEFLLEERVDQPIVKDTVLLLLHSFASVKCRVYELAVTLAKRSAGTLQKVEYILDNGINELNLQQDDDILFQVNILEIFVQLADQNFGLVYLESRKLLELVSKRVEELDQNPLDNLLVPGIMKFFGKIARVHPQKIITNYPHMIQCLVHCLVVGENSLLPVAFDTLANLSQSTHGKMLLDANYSSELESVFEQYATYLKHLPAALKIRLLNTMEVIFTVPVECKTPEASDILHKWFKYMAGVNANMQFLLVFCLIPFVDIKVACLALIKTLCTFPWGVTALKNTPGLVEYMLNRENETDKDVKYGKYDVIKLLAESNDFNTEIKEQFRAYINKGPLYVDALMDLAWEGNE